MKIWLDDLRPVPQGYEGAKSVNEAIALIEEAECQGSAYSRIEYRRRKTMNYRPEYDMKVMGRNLRRLREEKNLTVEDVREYLCLGSVQAVYKYETGRGYPQVDTMFALMELYDADMYDITRNDEEDVKSSSVIIQNLKLSA